MKKVKLLYNPKAGDKKISLKLDLIFEKYQNAGYLVEPFRLGDSLDLDIAFSKIDEYDHVLIAGGDGTIDIAVNYMKKNDINLPVGILPTGTANDFAKVIGMPLNLNDALDKILDSDAKKIDLGKINDQYFINIAGAGMFTEVSQKTNVYLKSSLGRLAYILKGVEDAVNPKAYNVKIKSKEFSYSGEIYIIIVLNGRTAGNINLLSDSYIDDGLLDVIVIKAMPVKRTISILFDILTGSDINNHPEVACFKTKEIYIEGDDAITTDIDGETGPGLPLLIKCEAEALNIKGI